MGMSQQRPPGSPPVMSLDAPRIEPTSRSASTAVPNNVAGGSDGESNSPSSESSYDPTTALMNEIDGSQPASPNKPKSATHDSSPDQGNTKRSKVALDAHGGTETVPEAFHNRSKQLPAEIWHHVFTFLPPRSLGNLLLVNKLFHNYLEPSPLIKVSYPRFPEFPPSSRKRLSTCTPDSIWQTSRRLFWPRMPSPLKGRSEVEMWRLACSKSCQFCSLQNGSNDEAVAKDQWHSGPGAKGVSPIFPFFVVSCGSCLVAEGLKEMDVFLSSSTPSALLPGLPVVFLTPEMHVIAPQTIQDQSSPTQGQLSKIYWKEQIEGIKAEFETVKGLGSAAAEEWLKGLEERGRLSRADAARWEKWELSGGVRQMRLTDTQTQISSGSSSPNRRGLNQRTGHIKMDGNEKSKPGTKSEPAHGTLERTNSSSGSQPRPQGHQKRTIEEVAKLKQQRKAEIERRAGLLDPPLVPAVLAQIPSFQAALQIIAPLDENAWELLRPRLLAQRAKAEQRERDSRANAKTSKDTTDGRGEPVGSRRDPRQVPDEEWDEIQGPVRARISNYADEITTDGWQEGDKVSKKNCPQFAAEVLLYVRKRFYAEVAKDAAAAVAAGKEPISDPPEGPWTQKLTLENMKWVFDVKIRPRTEKHRKELFLCNGCPANIKYYGFEGVIQHYAAKHTNALSLGNIVVHWRAEWPSTPPFHPDPKVPTLQHPPDRDAQQQPGPRPTQPPFTAGNAALNPPSSQQTAYFTGTSPAYGYALPGSYPPTSAVYPPALAPPAPYPASHATQSYTPQAPYAPYSAASPYGGSHPPTVPTPGGFPGHQTMPPRGSNLGPRGSALSDSRPSDQYKARLDFMGKVARQTWNSLLNISGLLGPVKLCVTVHHVAKGFQMRFSEPASLEMFIYGLSNNKAMRFLRGISGIKCKACMESTKAESESFSVPQLANHFLKSHSETQHLDWQTHMILLPALHVLEALPVVLEDHSEAYDTVADALPWAFPKGPETEVRAANRPHKTQGQSVPSYQPPGPYSEAYVPENVQDERGHGIYHSEPPAVHRELLDRPPYEAIQPESDRPNLRPAHEVYSRGDIPKVPMKREYEDEERQFRSGTGRPDKAPRVVLEEQPREVAALPTTHVPLSTEEMRRQRGFPHGAHVYGGHPEHSVVATERWEGDRRGKGPSVPASRPAEDEPQLLDALQSHLDGGQGTQGTAVQEPATHPATRPAEYHPENPARYVPSAAWAHPNRPPSPRYAPYPRQSEYYRERDPPEPRYPHTYAEPQHRYRDAPPVRPVEEYELLEVRDPDQGTYYIRRPIPREPYAYGIRSEARAHEHSPFRGSGHPGTMAPQSRADLEEYDPRFPAGDMPPQQPRYP